jgi:hypothetical protein
LDNAFSPEKLLTEIHGCTVGGLIFGLFKALFPTLNALTNLISRCLYLGLCLCSDVLIFCIATLYYLLRPPLRRVINAPSAITTNLDTAL